MKNSLPTDLSLIKTSTLLVVVFVLTAIPLCSRAQVSISYSDIEPQRNDTITNVALSEAEMLIPPVNADSVIENEKILRYAWYDPGFLLESVGILRELWKIRNRQLKKIVGGIDFYVEADRINEEFKETVDLIIASAALEIGYIPLDIQYKEDCVGDLANLPDITFELGNKLRDGDVSPCPTKITGKADLRIAIAHEELCMRGGTYGVLNSAFRKYLEEKRSEGFSEAWVNEISIKFTNDLSRRRKNLFANMYSKIYTIMDSLKLDGVIFAESSFAPVVEKSMVDVSYPLKKILMNDPDLESIKNIINDYR